MFDLVDTVSHQGFSAACMSFVIHGCLLMTRMPLKVADTMTSNQPLLRQLFTTFKHAACHACRAVLPRHGMRLQVLDLAKTMKLLLASADARAAAAAATKSGCQACLSRLLGQGSTNEQAPCAQQQVRVMRSRALAFPGWHATALHSGPAAMHVLVQPASCVVWLGCPSTILQEGTSTMQAAAAAT
jgi:hypothetical protein